MQKDSIAIRNKVVFHVGKHELCSLTVLVTQHFIPVGARECSLFVASCYTHIVVHAA